MADRNTQRATEEAERRRSDPGGHSEFIRGPNEPCPTTSRTGPRFERQRHLAAADSPGRPTDLRGWEWYYQDRLCHQELRTFRGNGDDNGKPAAVNAVIFSPDGNRLATAGDDGQVRLWDVATARELMARKGHTDAQVSNLRRSKSVSLRTAPTESALLRPVPTILCGFGMLSRARPRMF